MFLCPFKDKIATIINSSAYISLTNFFCSYYFWPDPSTRCTDRHEYSDLKTVFAVVYKCSLTTGVRNKMEHPGRSLINWCLIQLLMNGKCAAQ